MHSFIFYVRILPNKKRVIMITENDKSCPCHHAVVIVVFHIHTQQKKTNKNFVFSVLLLFFALCDKKLLSAQQDKQCPQKGIW